MGRGGKKPRTYPKPPRDARTWLFLPKTEPVLVTPSQSPQCPLQNAAARILSREESQDGHCDITYTVEITHHPDYARRTREEIVLVDFSAILDYVSPRELERFENADFRRLTEAENAAFEAEIEDEARQRLARNYRPKPGQTSAAPVAAQRSGFRGRPPGSRGTRGRGRGRGRPPGRGGLTSHSTTHLSQDVEPVDDDAESPPIEPPPGFARPTNLEDEIENDTESTDVEPPPGFHRAGQFGDFESEASEEDELSAPPGPSHVHRAAREGKHVDGLGSALPASSSRVQTVTDDEDDEEEEDEVAQVGQGDEAHVAPDAIHSGEAEDTLAAGQLDEEEIAPLPGFQRVSSDKDEDYNEYSDNDESEHSPSPSLHSAEDEKERPSKSKETIMSKVTNNHAPGFHQITPVISSKEQKPNLKKWRQSTLFNFKNAVPGFLKFQFISNSALPSNSKTAESQSSSTDSDDSKEIAESADEDEEDDVIKAKDVPAEYVEYDEESSDSASKPFRKSQPKSLQQSEPLIRAREPSSPQALTDGIENTGHRHKRRRTETSSQASSRQRKSSPPTKVVPGKPVVEFGPLDKMDLDPVADNQEQEDVYVVEKVLSHKTDKKGRKWYLVKWQGYEETEDWLAEEDLAEASDVVTQYHADLKTRARKNISNGSGVKAKMR